MCNYVRARVLLEASCVTASLRTSVANRPSQRKHVRPPLLRILVKPLNSFKMVNLGDVFPNFTAESTIGTLDFHSFLGDK